jgi:hypothetical protein
MILDAIFSFRAAPSALLLLVRAWKTTTWRREFRGGVAYICQGACCWDVPRMYFLHRVNAVFDVVMCVAVT